MIMMNLYNSMFMESKMMKFVTFQVICNDEVPDDKLILIDNFLKREYFNSAGDCQECPFSFDILKRKK